MSIFARSERALVVAYQAVRAGKPSPCRFVPSCSSYALDALDEYGFLHGNRLIASRLLRCRPFGGWGADPIPQRSVR